MELFSSFYIESRAQNQHIKSGMLEYFCKNN